MLNVDLRGELDLEHCNSKEARATRLEYLDYEID